MEVDFHVLGLLKFKEDTVVLKPKELKEIRDGIGKSFPESFIFDKMDPWHTWIIPPHYFRTLLSRISEVYEVSELPELSEVTMAYYHHRAMVLLKATVQADSFSALRPARDSIHDASREILSEHVQKPINSLVGSKRITPKAEVKYIYSYPICVIHTGKKLLEVEERTALLSPATTTIFFDLVEPGLRGKTHGIRISIPGVVIFEDRMLSSRFLQDVVNLVYEYCLYKKKLHDKERKPTNVISEDILVELWEHLMDVLGGRRSDLIILEVERRELRVGFAAVLLSITALIAPFLAPVSIGAYIGVCSITILLCFWVTLSERFITAFRHIKAWISRAID